MTPLLLLLFAAAADLGRVFYAYVAVENAAKEGVLFGSRSPLCDGPGAGGCTDPNNVTWHVQSDLQNLRNPDGTKLVPAVQCLDPGGTARAALKDCAEGDTYAVRVDYSFRLLTPILSDITGNLRIGSTSSAVVLNQAFDPTPGLSAQKLVLPTGATNATAITSNCLEPDDHDAQGYYRSPCLDTSTPDPLDKLSLHFDAGQHDHLQDHARELRRPEPHRDHRHRLAREHRMPVPDARSAPGGSSNPCTYTRHGAHRHGRQRCDGLRQHRHRRFAQTLPTTDGVTVVVERPPAQLQVLKWVSPFKDGDDGDGTPGFGTQPSATVSLNASVPQPSVWFKVIVRNVGGRTANAVAIADSRGALPYGQNNANAVCDAAPSSLPANGMFQCRYRVAFTAATTVTNTVTATSPDVVPRRE